jgi:hypothetical protein
MSSFRIECTLGPNERSITFQEAEELTYWLQKEQEYWSFVSTISSQGEMSRAFSIILEPYYIFVNNLGTLPRQIIAGQAKAEGIEKLRKKAPSDRSHEEERQIVDYSNFNLEDILRRITNCFSEAFQRGKVIPSISTKAKFLESLSTTASPEIALYAYGFLTKAKIKFDDPVSLRGAFAAAAFERGLTSREPSEHAALSDLKVSWDRKFQEINDDISSHNANLQKLISETSENLNQQRKAGQELLNNEKSDWANLHKAYDDSLALQKPVRFWQKKAESHRHLAKVFGAVSAIVAVVVFVLIYFLIDITLRPPKDQENSQNQVAKQTAALASNATPLRLGLTNSITPATNNTQLPASSPDRNIADWHPEYWRIAVLLAGGVFSVWIVRIFVRLFLSHIHLLADANERVTMAQTYLSLLRHQKGIQEKDREMILQALFRPASTGVVKDDGVPLSWIEMVTKVGRGGQ